MKSIRINKYYKISSSNIKKLTDIKYSFQYIIFIIIILITWSGIQSIESNYRLEKQISELNQQNQITQLDNQNIDLNNKYYQSKQYLELTARANLGLANSGEQELLVPKNVALSYTIPNPSDKKVKDQARQSSPSNIQSWIDFFLHRNNFKAS